MSEFPILSFLIFLPVAGAVILMLVPEERRELHLPLGVGLGLLPVALGGVLFFQFERGTAEFQFVERADWIQQMGIGWHLGVDGISVLLIVLTTILVPIALAASVAITERVRLFIAMTLLLEAGLIGVFSALDLFLFFVFFEVILVPMAFIIGIWGSENRIYAAVKFFIYTAFGSALMLAGIIALAFIHRDQFGVISFDYLDMLALDLGSST